MKKIVTPYKYESSSGGDYKLEHIEQEAINNLESTNKWLYLGADILNPNFAKIGITMGDLSSRSYSSSCPSYYLFCAFQFDYNTPKQVVDRVEKDVLHKIDNIYRNEDGTSKKMVHYESQQPSECFYPIDFFDLYKNLHYEIYTQHRNNFIICNYTNEVGMDEGEFVYCIFNSRQKDHHDEYTKMILQY